MTYRILSLDGGGSWALIELAALKSLYGDAGGWDLLSRFDLVAANSGGSLVLAGLCENWRLSEIETLFLNESRRREVFHSRWHVPVFGARYSTRAKQAALLRIFNDMGRRPMPEVAEQIRRSKGHCPRLLITAFDYDRRRAAYFRSDLTSRAGGSTPFNVRLADAAHASSNAPVKYFDEPAEITCYDNPAVTRRFWDGGVAGLNNPTLAAVTEALANDPDERAAMKVLSLGTAGVFRPLSPPAPASVLAEKVDRGGWTQFFDNVSTMASTVLDDPPDFATFVAHVTLGGTVPLPPAPADVVDVHADGEPSPVVRMNPLIQPWWDAGTKSWTLLPGWADLKTFDRAANLDMDAVEQRDVELIGALATAWQAGAAPNQPVQAGENFSCRIGHRTFASAAAAWRAIA